MFRFYSIVATIVVVIFGFITFVSHNNDFGWDIPNFESILFYASILLLLLLLMRIQIRWQQLWLTKSLPGYKLSKRGWSKCCLNESLTYFIYIPIAVLLLVFIANSFWFVFIVMIYFIESALHLFVGKKQYKLVFNDKSILVLKNTQKIIYWNRLENISFRYQGVLLLENTGSQVYISETDFEGFKDWKEQLKRMAFSKDIYVEIS